MPAVESQELGISHKKRRIIAAAHEEIKDRGILGLRVANVAARSGCSVASMYRFFGGRDVLLAEVLMALYEESFERQFAVVRDRLAGTGPVTVDDIVASIPLPLYPDAKKDHALRSQVLAVAGTNPVLRAWLAESITAKRRMLATVLDDLAARLPAGVELDREVITVLVFNITWQYNDLLGDSGVTNEQYTSLLRRLIAR